MEALGFKATGQMYKKQFTRWNLRKYNKRSQKDQDAHRLMANALVGVPQVAHVAMEYAPLIPAHVGMHQDHEKGCGRPTEVEDCESTEVPLWTGLVSASAHIPAMLAAENESNKTDCGGCNMLSNGESQSPEGPENPLYDPINVVILNTDAYFRQIFSWDKARQPFGFTKSLADVFNHASSARRALLNDDKTRGNRLAREAIENIPALVSQAPLQLISETCRRFASEGWTATPHIKKTILKQIAAKTIVIHGPSHPLSIVMTSISHEQIPADMASAIFRTLADLITQKLHRSSKDRFATLQDLADCFCNIGDFDDARKICQSSLAQAEIIFPPHHSIMRNIKRDLGQIHYKQGEWKEAERLWRGVFELTIKDQGAPNRGATGRLTCEYLGALYRTRCHEGDLELSAAYFRLALESAIEAWGAENLDTLEYFDDVAAVLQQAGAIEELMQLYRRYEVLLQLHRPVTAEKECKL